MSTTWNAPRSGEIDAGPASLQTAGPNPSGSRLAELSPAILTGIVAGYAGALAILFWQHKWILAPSGKPIASDFLVYWTAGIAALQGKALAVYSVPAFHVMQVSHSGPFLDFYYWNYPPVVFFVLAVLGLLPFVFAFVLWVVGTGAACALTLGKVAAERTAILAALASPAFLLTAYVGQNGFLTAALMGGFLLCLPARPLAAGVLLALLTYKPQFGILIPLALIAGGYWRAMGWAIAVTVITGAASALVFGAESYIVFIRSLSFVSHSYLTLGGEGWSKIESIYSVSRFLGANDTGGWVAQFLLTAVCAIGIFRLWRSSLPFSLKAAGLVVAAMLSTPYLHEYDFPVLLTAFAFLYRHQPFDRGEWAAVLVANLMIAGFFGQWAPIGPFIVLIAGAMVIRRAMSFQSSETAPLDADKVAIGVPAQG
ncbi:MAG TPA: glycosyltransferase family 87 protein [Rhizomicrobium sp.]|jgi:hypothetical protein